MSDPMQRKEGIDFRFLIAPALWTGCVAAGCFLYPTDYLQLGHLFGTAMNFGMTTYFTCFAGSIMFQNLPRPQFAKVQAKLFPIYFAFQSLSSFLVALSMYKYSDNLTQNIGAYLSFFFAISQTLILEPKTNAALDVFMAVRKEEGEESKTQRFKKAKGKFYAYHGVSSLFNICSFLLQTVHIYWLCQSGKFSM